MSDIYDVWTDGITDFKDQAQSIIDVPILYLYLDGITINEYFLFETGDETLLET